MTTNVTATSHITTTTKFVIQMSSWVASGRTGRHGVSAPRPAEAETSSESEKNYQVEELDHFRNNVCL